MNKLNFAILGALNIEELIQLFITMLLHYKNNPSLGNLKFEEWFESAFKTIPFSFKISRNISNSRNSKSSGKFPDFFLDVSNKRIYIECKQFSGGTTAEIQDNSTLSCGKYMDINSVIHDVYYIYCQYDGSNIVNWAIIDGLFYGDDPNLLGNMRDFVWDAINNETIKQNKNWKLTRPNTGMYIQLPNGKSRCRVRLQYHTENPFHNKDLKGLKNFCLITKFNRTIDELNQEVNPFGINFDAQLRGSNTILTSHFMNEITTKIKIKQAKLM